LKPEQVCALLARTKLFGVLDRDVLLKVAEDARTRRFDRGDHIFHQGDPGECLYVIAEGHIKVFVVSEEGAEMVLATLRPPDLFGELAIIDDGPRSASTKAIEPSILLAFSRASFRRMLIEYPGLAESVSRSLGATLRRVLDQAADLIFLDLPGRVAKLLVTLAEDRSTGDGTEKALDLHLTQGTIAGMVGGSRSSVNQILRGFEARGLLAVDGRRIILKDEGALRRRAAAY
jgi:CRP/FNR family transcriptional regulator, cyclic AMP receptor protein